MHYYELLTVDGDRTRSVWLTHPDEMTQDDLLDRLAIVEGLTPPQTIARWFEESKEMQRDLVVLGHALHLDAPLLNRIEEAAADVVPRFRDISEPLIDALCERFGFHRLTATAVAVRFGQEVLPDEVVHPTLRQHTA